MDSSVAPKDETWFLRVCHHISNAVYIFSTANGRSLCLYVMRRLTVRFVLRLELHDFALRTRNHSSSSFPYFHIPHASVQLLSTQQHCGRYRIVLSLLVCVYSVFFRHDSVFVRQSSGKLFICSKFSDCCLEICTTRS